MAKNKPTKAKLEELLRRFVELCEEGQMTWHCSDADELEADIRDLLNVPVQCSRVTLVVVLDNVKLPHGANPEDANNYDVSVNVVDGSLGGIEIENVSDYEN